MDRNSIIGAVMIALILIAGSYFFKSGEEQNPKQNTEVIRDTVSSNVRASIDSAKAEIVQDSAATAQNVSTLPAMWAPFTKGSNTPVTIENEKLLVKISPKGGHVAYVELKGYKTFDGKPLVLLNEESSHFNYHFVAGNDEISTTDLYFTSNVQTQAASEGKPASVTMSLTLADGKTIEQVYTLNPNSYMVGYDLRMKGMQDVIPRRINYIELNWVSDIIAHEKDYKISKGNTTIYYRNQGESADYLSETKDVEEKFKANTDWFSFKEQFFCQTLISKQPFERGEFASVSREDSAYIKTLKAKLSLPFTHTPEQTYNMQFYFGPLHYATLKSYDLDLESQIPLGWGIFSYVNKFIIIPTFNVLNKFISNYGIIILLLTLVIKVITLPFTYKSYLSTAKMRILKPELDELRAKYGNDMARMQQEQMKMYRQAGVSPFGGCLPLLLQTPILIAMFRFFPSSIELRQESFLWAKDLSTYDSIWDFGYVPILHTIYGDHVSLFTILMTVSTIIYTRMNSNISAGPNDFKWMQYMMPIFFLGFFNNYSAGLSLYYFLFNILTFAQQYIFKLVIDDKKLIAKIEENKKRPASATKSKFQQKLEDLTKQQRQVQEQRSRKK